MRAVVCRDLTGPQGLSLEGWPDPVPGPGEAVVALAAAGVNFPDLLMVQGLYQLKPPLPFVPGMEGAGVVAAVGAGVDAGLIGQPVMAMCRTGAFAERVVVDAAHGLAAVPHGWSMPEAAAFPVAARTAYHALVHRAGLMAGETVLVNGASGGTGHMAVMLAKALDARVVASTSDPAKRGFLASLGADVVIDAGSADFADHVKDATGGRGADVVFDPVGGGVLDASLKATAVGARVCIVGFTAGAANALMSNYILIKRLSLLGIRAGEAARADPVIARDYATTLMRLAASNDLRPRIAQSLPLAHAGEALSLLAARGVTGKLVLTSRR